MHNGLTIYGAWLKGCETNHTMLWLLEDDDRMQETGLFKLTSEYMVNGYTYYRSPVYVVWWAGKQVLCSMNYMEAVKKWNELERSSR